MAKERMVTRRVIESKKYQIFKMDGTQLILLEEIETKGKLSEKELAEKHKVKKVVIVLIEEKKVTYGVPVSKFMEIAELIEDEKTETAETAEAETAETAEAETAETAETAEAETAEAVTAQ